MSEPSQFGICDKDAPDANLEYNCESCEGWWTEEQVYNKETSKMYFRENAITVSYWHCCPNGCINDLGEPYEAWWAWGNKLTPYMQWFRDELEIVVQQRQDALDEAEKELCNLNRF